MLKLKLQYFGHLMQSWLTGKDPDAGKDWRREEKGRTEDEMAGRHHQLYGHQFKRTPGVGDGQGSLACCSPWGHKELDMTEWLNWTEISPILYLSFKLTPVWGSLTRQGGEKETAKMQIPTLFSLSWLALRTLFFMRPCAFLENHFIHFLKLLEH